MINTKCLQTFFSWSFLNNNNMSDPVCLIFTKFLFIPTSQTTQTNYIIPLFENNNKILHKRELLVTYYPPSADLSHH